MLFQVGELFLNTSEARACCAEEECAGSTQPPLLETLQLSKCICINTSVINMFSRKSSMFKEHSILFPNYVGSSLCGRARCFTVAFISVQLFVWLIGPLHA